MKKILVVMCLNMKRLDSWVEFNRLFVAESLSRGYKVEYLLPNPPCKEVLDYFKETKFKLYVFKYWRYVSGKQRGIRLGFECWKHQLRGGYDLITFHFCGEVSVLIFSILARLSFSNPKIVWHQHSEICRLRKGSVKRFLSQLKILSLFIDCICPVYQGIKETLLERGILPSKIRVLHNGINIDLYKASSEDNASLLHDMAGNDHLKIMAIGGLIHLKGFDIFLKCAQRILQKHPQVSFFIVGEGVLRDELLVLSKKLGVEKNVWFLGKRSDVFRLLKEIDIFVLTSRTEALPFVTIEAMAAGKPVVASCVGGVPEIVEDQRTGILVKAEDVDGFSSAILMLIENPQLRSEMGSYGQMLVETKFTLRKMTDSYYALYTELLR